MTRPLKKVEIASSLTFLAMTPLKTLDSSLRWNDGEERCRNEFRMTRLRDAEMTGFMDGPP